VKLEQIHTCVHTDNEDTHQHLQNFKAPLIFDPSSSIESKLDQILQRLDSPTCSAQSDGAQTYLVGPDRFQELKEWFKEFCIKELKEEESEGK
jgi:hypothetical protein